MNRWRHPLVGPVAGALVWLSLASSAPTGS